VSMATVKLSSVMAACGGSVTIRSRVSTLSRTRSMNGMTKLRPPDSVRVYRPRRSMMAASPCGTRTMALVTSSATSSTSTPATIRPVIDLHLLVHDGRVAVDAHDRDPIPLAERGAGHERPGGPEFAGQPHEAGGAADGFLDGGGAPGEHAGVRFDFVRPVVLRHFAAQHRADHAEQAGGGHREHGDVDPQRCVGE